MATQTPLYIDSNNDIAKLPSGDALGGITGGTASGEAMTQDQFGANSSQMTPSGNPTFDAISATMLSLKDADTLHRLHILTTEEFGGNRTLDIQMGDTSRTLTFTGSPTLVAGTMIPTSAIGSTVQAYDADLDAIAALSSSGLIARTGAGAAAARTITLGSSLSGSNLNGVSGNPTFDTIQDIRTSATGFRVAGLGVGMAPTYLVDILSPTLTDFGTKWAVRARGPSSCTTNASNFMLAFDMDVSDMSVSAGVTDSGYRMGVRGNAIASTTGFAGTLATQYGVLGRAGISSATSGAVVTNANGLYGEVLNGVAGTTVGSGYAVRGVNTGTTGTMTHRWGAHIETGGSTGKNYFSDTIMIGVQTPPSGAVANLVLSGSTRTLGAATADCVSQAAPDNGAGNAEWQVQPESGGLMAYGADVLRRVPTANNNVDDRVKKITTTDATVTTVDTIPITASSTYLIQARVIGRRTGGVSGTADDGCSYVRRGTYTTKSGVVTLLGAVETIGTDREDQAGFDATLTISGTNVLVRVTGAASNNMSWQAHTLVERIAS